MGGRGSSSRSASSVRGGAQFLSQTKGKLSAWLNASNATEELNARKSIVGVSRFANRRIKMIDSKLYDLGKTMDQTAGDATGYPMGVPTASKAGYDRYRKAQREFADLNVLRGQLVQAKSIADSVQAHFEAGGSNKDYSKKPSKTFVNSFGEATDRYITSGTYERAQRRLNKQIQSRMKGFR